MNFIVYLHRKERGPDAGDVFYVGFAKVPTRPYEVNRRGQNKWTNFYNKYGRTVEIVGQYETKEEAFIYEKAFIRAYRDAGFELANVSDGGEGNCGERSAAAKANMSAGQKKRVRSEYEILCLQTAKLGYKVSDETKERARQAALKRWARREPPKVYIPPPWK